MGTRKHKWALTAVASAAIALATAGAAAAFQTLPPGGQVNDDPVAGINGTLSVSGDDPANADVVGGALTAGKVAVPWAVFRQTEASATDQVFSRSFAGGAWTTRGSGTVGGRSSAPPSPPFSGSLNFDQTQDGEAPAIDFAGAGRTVPWATWYEHVSGLASTNNNIFASRFDNTGDANQGKWLFGGQGRGPGGGTVPIPSLNIHTDQDAENPSVAGGSAADATKPGPWITWQETSTATGNPDQIFVSRPIGPGSANCDTVTPLGQDDGTGHVPAIGGFCWQQTGVPRFPLGSPDPSLNVDPTRDGVEPDIAFTGKTAAGVQDGVPWVVWYEKGDTNNPLSGLTHDNEMVFAAKGLADPTAGRGGFSWTAVGSQNSALLDDTGTNHFGGCAASDAAEAGCSLNKNPDADAEDPRVAAGTMNPANPTVPWVTWDETLNGVNQVFVSRLITTAPAHFELANSGQPISLGANDSTRPDITFSGDTPYVSWREDIGGGIEKAFVGHFVNAANPTFVLDESDVSLTPTADVREPISSGCTANPFNQDGAACQGAAVGTPFFLFTNGTSPLGLFADAYQPGTPVTGAASGVGVSTATIAGSVDPDGAAVSVSFQFGATAAYGQSTPSQTLGPDDVADPFTAALSGLPAGTTIHYRAVAATDFGTLVGADQSFVTGTAPGPPLPAPPSAGKASAGRPKVSGRTVTLKIRCSGGTTCHVSLRLTVTETFAGKKLIAVSARRRRTHKKVVVVGGRTTGSIAPGHSVTLRIKLNRTGIKLLATRHRFTAELTVRQSLAGRTKAILSRKVRFSSHAPKRRHNGG
jgi:hypothetical protein